MQHSGLEVQELTHLARREEFFHRLQRKEILHGMSFHLEASRVAGLVGQIGAGKTTLLHCLAGLRPILSGKATLDGQPLRRGDLALVDQRASLPRELTIADLGHLCEGYNTGFDRALFLKLIDRFDLTTNVRIKRVSEGQRKVIAIATALARHARLLLLDEPLASLDPMSRRGIMGEVLATASEDGTTILLSSHLVADIERDCDWLLILDGGQLLVSEAIDTLIEHHVYLADMRDTDGTLVTAGGGRSLVRRSGPSDDDLAHPGLEEIVIGYLDGAKRQRNNEDGSPAFVSTTSEGEHP
ncbi:ATP-binding cassette domain-containing protein [Ferrimicrobium sp.]|uniref:ATP-binding cassette domain-containing protein n=1 Tax=Ferrimicrobium sp. TaxID=2926050 RepID=UPI0026274D9F|nr:ATP-binding cassette domain-containing protein [Ferrimicrobium sp.]